MYRPKKFICRVCGKNLPYARGRKYPATNMRVKYFKCECGAKFKSVEKIVPLGK